MQTSNLRGLLYDLPSNEYHNEKGSFSSSQLKDLVEDPEYFYRKHIKKEIEKEQIPAFDIGTYFHTALLEPEKLSSECAVFEGIRRGKEWDKFKEDNANKAIITKTEFDQALGLINAVRNSPIATGRLGRGKPEVSCFVELLICGSEIYSTELGAVLTLNGWSKAKTPKKGIKLVIKVRADLLGTDFILDLKSTTGNSKSAFQMRQKISNYQYDLSAALYIDMFNVYVTESIADFIWVFSSKDYFNSKSYVASNTLIQIGRAKYMKALLSLAEGIETDWQFEDSLGVLEPQPYELEWIKQKDGDLL